VPAEQEAPTTFSHLARRWRPEAFIVSGMEAAQTPALVVDGAAVDANIATMRELLGTRWRPHVKAAKLEWTMRRLVAAGVVRCKCATPLELATALRAGFEDVLVAFAHRGPGARRIAELAAAWPAQQVSVLIEDPSGLDQWRGTRVSAFVDVDPGIGRSGIPCTEVERCVALARAAAAAGVRLRGLHSYEGVPVGETEQDRRDWCNRGFDALCVLHQALAADGHLVAEVVTSNSLTWPLALAHPPLAALPCDHTVSPGTVVYSDADTALMAPAGETLRPAAAVLTRVTSIGPRSVTFDAGHKAIALAKHGPCGVVLGFPDLLMDQASEEHGRATCAAEPSVGYGDLLAVVPSDIGPTVNLHDHAVIVSDGTLVGIERVTARGHDAPL
jgi:D-serine deaminase-like pyridoxal phosphate-dependent protein